MQVRNLLLRLAGMADRGAVVVAVPYLVEMEASGEAEALPRTVEVATAALAVGEALAVPEVA